MTFEQAIEDLKRRPLTDFVELTRSRKAGANMYCCPICKSGTHDRETGALKVDPYTKRVTCFSGKNCFTDKGEDTAGALSKIWGCSLPEVLTRAGYQLDRTQTAPAPRPKREPKPEPQREDFTEQYKLWNASLLQDEKALAWMKDRGITEEAIKHFLLGYAHDWIHPSNMKYKNPKKEDRFIFPRSRYAYSARAILKDAPDKYKVIDQKTMFNTRAMEDTQDQVPVVVVEGEIDAINIWQLGFQRVVALGSTKNKELFIRQAKAINPNATYILSLDNDPGENREGQESQAYIADALNKAGIAYINAETSVLYDGMKDAADAIKKDAGAFTERMTQYIERGYAMRQERDKAAEIEAYKNSGPGMVDSFLQDVQTMRYQPISSGIKALDRALGGGFVRESVVMIGAAPGMGKTALVSQICENIAASGAADVLYINLEMSRSVMLARSIARIANAKGKTVSVNDVLHGYSWDAGTREIISMAADEYKATVAGHLIYNPGEPQTDLDSIMQKIENEKRRLGHAPIVCIDYLQLLTGRPDEDTIEVIKRTMQTLKQYANDNSTIVFLITANNRDSMKTGESGLNSGRDSSNIEYGSDVHAGLEYACVASTVKNVEADGEGNVEPEIEKGKDLSFIGAIKRAYLKMIQRTAGRIETEQDKLLQEAYNKYCTRYTVRINKNRYGDGDSTATLLFDGASARFVELDTIHTEDADRASRVIDPEHLPF